MILTVTIYETDTGPRFRCYATDGNSELQDMVDVSDQYDLVATKTGFAVNKRAVRAPGHCYDINPYDRPADEAIGRSMGDRG